MRKTKTKTYYASRRDITAEGETISKARAALVPMIDYACTLRYPHVEVRYGYVLIASPSAVGYVTTMLWPNNLKTDGSKDGCHTLHPQTATLEDIVRRLRLNAAQVAWHLDVDDVSHEAKSGLDGRGLGELRSFIRFHRRYAAEQDNENGV